MKKSGLIQLSVSGLLLTVLGVSGCGVISVQAGADQSVMAGETVTLTSTATFSFSSSNTSFTWMQLEGKPAELVGENSPNVSFEAPNVDETKTLVFEITVASSVRGTSIFDQDRVSVTVEPAPDPTAAAGDDFSANATDVVELDGSGAGGAGEVVTFSWEQVGGPAVELTTSGKDAEFIAPDVDEATEVVFELAVTGLAGKQALDRVTVTIQPARPSAKAGENQTVIESEPVTLDGSESTLPVEGDLVYLWEQISGPEVTLSGASDAVVTFEAPAVEEETLLRFELIVVADPQLTTDTDLIEITVEPYPDPLAAAGDDQVVSSAAVVTLDATSSSDPGGNTLTYAWTPPDGITITAETTNQAIFIAPNVTTPKTYTFTVTVTNIKGATASDTVNITVTE